MGDVFGKPAIVTDTHCIRLTNRIGLVDGIKEPKKVEMALWKIIPPEEEVTFATVLFIMEERYVLRERNRIMTDVVWQMFVKRSEYSKRLGYNSQIKVCEKNLKSR